MFVHNDTFLLLTKTILSEVDKTYFDKFNVVIKSNIERFRIARLTLGVY